MNKLFFLILFLLSISGTLYSQAWWELDIAGHMGSGDNSNRFMQNDIKAFIHRDPAQRNREANELKTTSEWKQSARALKRIEQLMRERMLAMTELQEAIGGDTTLLVQCTKCLGSTFEPCITCHSKGYLTCPMCDGLNKRPCRICEGSGIVNEQTCMICQGSGKSICKACNGTSAISCKTCDGASGRNCSLCRGAGKLIRK